MKAPPSVLDLIATLVEQPPFSARETTRMTGVALTKDAERSNAAFDIYRADNAKGPLSTIEVRQRVNPKPGKQGLVILEISDTACISQEQVKTRFPEKADGLIGPTPHQPTDSPVYWTYKKSWGELRLGFAQTGNRCLVAVVLDGT